MNNFKQIELTKEQYDLISAIRKGKEFRFNSPYHYCTSSDPKWDVNIFDENEEKQAKNKVYL